MTALVMGASGFLGSHVVADLVARGERVRAMVRPSSSLRAIDGLGAEVVYGDVLDAGSVRAAMAGCDDVYYCVLDARPWLRDPRPMVRTNVEALEGVLEAALSTAVRRFVYTSTIATLAIDRHALVDETRPHNWSTLGGPYVASRVWGEGLVLAAAREHGLPAIAMCVANTYGAGDLLPTPHGALLRDAALGRLPFYVRGAGAEVVHIDDAASALTRAAARGRPGERYIVSAGHLSMRDVVTIGAEVGGVRPPRRAVPKSLMQVAGLGGEALAAITRRDVRLTRTTARLMHVMTPLDHGKAVCDLDWQPRPPSEAVSEGAAFFLREHARRRGSAAGPAAAAVGGHA